MCDFILKVLCGWSLRTWSGWRNMQQAFRRYEADNYRWPTTRKAPAKLSRDFTRPFFLCYLFVILVRKWGLTAKMVRSIRSPRYRKPAPWGQRILEACASTILPSSISKFSLNERHAWTLAYYLGCAQPLPQDSFDHSAMSPMLTYTWRRYSILHHKHLNHGVVAR